jgi:hypothetical protein
VDVPLSLGSRTVPGLSYQLFTVTAYNWTPAVISTTSSSLINPTDVFVSVGAPTWLLLSHCLATAVVCRDILLYSCILRGHCLATGLNATIHSRNLVIVIACKTTGTSQNRGSSNPAVNLTSFRPAHKNKKTVPLASSACTSMCHYVGQSSCLFTPELSTGVNEVDGSVIVRIGTQTAAGSRRGMVHWPLTELPCRSFGLRAREGISWPVKRLLAHQEWFLSMQLVQMSKAWAVFARSTIGFVSSIPI